MNKDKILKENENIREIIIKKTNEKEFKSIDEYIVEINNLLENYTEEECLKNTQNHKVMGAQLNELCYLLSKLFNKAKLINETIISNNSSVYYKFSELNCKMINPPNVANIDASINHISLITQKFYNLIYMKYKNESNLFKIQLGFMNFTPNRRLNRKLLSENDNTLLIYIDTLLKLQYVKYLYDELSNILLCINCNYIE